MTISKDVGVTVRFADGTERALNTEEWGDEALPHNVQIRAILKALRVILDVPQGVSILDHAILVKRRGDDWHNCRTPLQQNARALALAIDAGPFPATEELRAAVTYILAITASKTCP